MGLRCLRLSYHQRVVDSVPGSFRGFAPDKPDPTFKYEALPETENNMTCMISAKLVNAIKAKCAPEEIQAILKEVPDDEGSDQATCLRNSIFVQTLLNMGNKSFSHSFAAIAKFHPTLKTLNETEEAQLSTLKSVFELWNCHQQMMVVLVDKMINDESESDSEDSDMETGENKNRNGERKRHSNKSGEKPSEDQVEKLEERLEAAQADQKNLFLIIFQRFIMILSEHLVRCDTDGIDFKTPWYRWTVGRLQQIFMMHHEQVEKYSTTLETLLFTQDLDPNILDVFQQFVALRM